MKISTKVFAAILFSAVIFSSCTKTEKIDDKPKTVLPEDFEGNIVNAMDSRTQTFKFNAEDGYVTFTSEKGVELSIDGTCLKMDGNDVTGEVSLNFVEMFDRGSMMVTNKPTMGVMADGKKSLLISGGEFLISVTQNGKELDYQCGVHLQVPTDLSGGEDLGMKLFTGGVDDDCNGVVCDVNWEEEKEAEFGIRKGEEGQPTAYFAFFNGFGWTNVDRFYSDERPKTTILVDVPEGFNNENSAVYLSYDGEPTALANLDTYTVDGLFSEHYGQIPIGLECHVIFATADGDNWRYAIKAVTIVEDAVIEFDYSETQVATEEELSTIINNLP